MLRPVRDAAPADWIVEHLTTFAENVGSIVPGIFEAYARVFHPAGKGEGSNAQSVGWGAIAQVNGKTAHAEMQFEFIVPTSCFDRDNYKQGQPRLWDWPPGEGSVPDNIASDLAATFRRFTSTPEHCYFAYWQGWGDPVPMWPPPRNDQERRAQAASLEAYEDGSVFEGSPREHRDAAPEFRIPGREYYLFEGQLEEVTTEWDGIGGELPTMWWPEDRAWFVHTEIDFDSTYIGGSRACIDALLGDPAIETLETEIEHAIGAASDAINRDAAN